MQTPPLPLLPDISASFNTQLFIKQDYYLPALALSITGPQITSLSKLFPYNIDEISRDLTLIYIISLWENWFCYTHMLFYLKSENLLMALSEDLLYWDSEVSLHS